MVQVLYVMCAGALGALSRWGTDLAARHMWGTAFPYGTLIANAVGCFLFGLFMELAAAWGLSKNVRLMVTTGFLGSFTTFSTFSYNSVSFLKEGQMGLAALNIGLNLVMGLLAVYAGSWAGRVAL